LSYSYKIFSIPSALSCSYPDTSFILVNHRNHFHFPSHVSIILSKHSMRHPVYSRVVCDSENPPCMRYFLKAIILLVSLQTLSCNCEITVIISIVSYRMLVKPTHAPRSTVYCTRWFNFTFDLRPSADLVLVGKSSFVAAWARAYFIPIFAAELSPTRHSFLFRWRFSSWNFNLSCTLNLLEFLAINRNCFRIGFCQFSSTFCVQLVSTEKLLIYIYVYVKLKRPHYVGTELWPDPRTRKNFWSFKINRSLLGANLTEIRAF